MDYLNFGLEDYINAGTYAVQQVKKYRFQTQRTENRWNLPWYELGEQPYKNEFYLPEELQSDYRSYTLKFPEKSCLMMSCFFNLDHDKFCPKRKEDRKYNAIRRGGDVYLACQDGCYMNEFSEVPFVCETYFENGECFMRNVAFKHYCIFPKARNNHVYAMPPFTYDEKTGNCDINQKYCEFYGVDFDSHKKDCYVTGGQKFAEEYIFGKTLFRAFKLLATKTPRLESGVAADDEGNIILNILHDLGIDATGLIFKHLSLKGIPLLNRKLAQVLITRFQSRFGLAVARAAAVSLVLETMRSTLAAQIALKVSDAVATASTVVGFILLYFSVVGLILDSIDPLSLSTQLSAAHVQKVKYGFDHLFAKQFNHNTKCVPEFFINIYSKGVINEQENLIYMEHMCIYLSKLKYSSDGHKVIRPSSTGLSVEQIITRILHATSKIDDQQSLKPKMDSLFAKFAMFVSILVPIFLAISV